jgi:phosphoadenosine phosphosulfate reductase
MSSSDVSSILGTGAQSGLRPSQPSKATQLHARPSANYAEKLQEAQATLQQAALLGASNGAADNAASIHERLVTQASSLGAEDVVITHLINSLALDIPVFVLETGALHTETLALLERTQAQSRAPIIVYRPEHTAVMQFVRNNGQDAMYQSIDLRKACCGIRKMEPLARALAGKAGWITGLRREQSNARADVPLIDTSELRSQNTNATQAAADTRMGDANAGMTKFNPLANWTWGDVWHYIATNGVDYNPLHDQFYPSIGCAPCTRAISLGEDFRSGRWWWEDENAKECGLHVKG